MKTLAERIALLERALIKITAMTEVERTRLALQALADSRDVIFGLAATDEHVRGVVLAVVAGRAP